MAGSGLFHNVVNASSGVEPDHLLEGRVKTLYGDFRKKTECKAVPGVELLLIRNSTNHPRIIFNHEYHEEIPLKNDVPYGLVQGWSEALGRILSQFEDDLERILK